MAGKEGPKGFSGRPGTPGAAGEAGIQVGTLSKDSQKFNACTHRVLRESWVPEEPQEHWENRYKKKLWLKLVLSLPLFLSSLSLCLSLSLTRDSQVHQEILVIQVLLEKWWV